jgi:division protein 1
MDDLIEIILDIEEGSTHTSNDSFSDNEQERHEGVCFKSIEGHTDDILCLDFNHPKGILVSASLDGVVRAWDLYRNQHLGNIEGHTEPVRCLQLNEARLLTGSNDCTIKQWDLSLISNEHSDETLARETFTLRGHQAAITTFDASQHMLVSGSNDRTIRQWDLETQECVLSLDVSWEFQQGNQMDYLHDFVGALQVWDFAMATGTLDGKIRMWDSKLFILRQVCMVLISLQ